MILGGKAITGSIAAVSERTLHTTRLADPDLPSVVSKQEEEMEYIKLRNKQATTNNEERMLQRLAEATANTLTPIETHSICVLLSIGFGTGTM